MSSLYCISHEQMFYTRPWDEIMHEANQYIPFRSLPHVPFRFRDNLVGVG